MPSPRGDDASNSTSFNRRHANVRSRRIVTGQTCANNTRTISSNADSLEAPLQQFANPQKVQLHLGQRLPLAAIAVYHPPGFPFGVYDPNPSPITHRIRYMIGYIQFLAVRSPYSSQWVHMRIEHPPRAPCEPQTQIDLYIWVMTRIKGQH